MVDVAEIVGGPPAIDQSGNLTIWWVPAIANPQTGVTLAEIGAVTAFRLTYSFLPGGWNLTMPQDKEDDDRLTSPQRKQALGKVNPDLADLAYVDSDAPGSAAVVLKLAPGELTKKGYFVERRNVAQTVLATAAQKVRIIGVSLGVQGPGPTQGTGKFSILQSAVVEGVFDGTILPAGG